MIEGAAAVMDRHVAAEVAQVTLRVVSQIRGRGEPNVTRASACKLVEDQPSELPALPNASSITKEEAATLRWRSWDHFEMACGGKRNRLQLQ